MRAYDLRQFELYEARQLAYGKEQINTNSDPWWGSVLNELNEEFENSELENFFKEYITDKDYKNELKQNESEIGDWFVDVQLIPAGKQSRLLLIIDQITEVTDRFQFKKEITIEGINIGAIVFKDKEAAYLFITTLKSSFEDDFDIRVRR